MAKYEEVLLFSMEGCPYCEQARTALRASQQEFREIEVLPRSELFSHLAAILGEVRVPIVVSVGYEGSCSFGPAAYCTLPEKAETTSRRKAK
jgi:glutaredoxin